jgi:uncharacterized membrane-anchored protein YitT (DUF2179 family)
MSKGFIQIILLIFGAIIQGMAMAQFLFPHNIPSGGGAGIAILIHHFLHLPLGFSLWLSNAVFLIFALNFFGLTWTLKTIFAVALTAITVNFITDAFMFYHIHIFADIVLGGIFYGIGVGILIRVGASSGGMVIPALMIARFRNWHPGTVILWINGLIFLFTSVAIDFKIILFAFVCQMISTRVIDFIYFIHIPRPLYSSILWRKK